MYLDILKENSHLDNELSTVVLYYSLLYYEGSVARLLLQHNIGVGFRVTTFFVNFLGVRKRTSHKLKFQTFLVQIECVVIGTS